LRIEKLPFECDLSVIGLPQVIQQHSKVNHSACQLRFPEFQEDAERSRREGLRTFFLRFFE
jgi:hypothetical protein